MGSASETARGSHLHPKPVAGNRHHGQEEGIHDSREEEEAEDPAQEESCGGAEEGAGEEGRGEAKGDRREVWNYSGISPPFPRNAMWLIAAHFRPLFMTT